jgi:uncharacterized protein (DUF58 family)
MKLSVGQNENGPNINTTSEPTSFLLNKITLLALAGILLVAAWNGLVVIVILLGLALSAALLARLWGRFSLAGVSCERTLSEDHVFPGETVELKLRLTNRKILPLPWVRVQHSAPRQMVGGNAAFEQVQIGNLSTLEHTASLFWYSAVSWRHILHCNRRGYYHLGNITVNSGDIFGLYQLAGTYPSTDTITVYPRIYPIEQFALPSVDPLGETRAERRIFEDQTRTIGVRDYSPHDSPRYIHWKASARHQNLQVKVFEPTTTLKVALFLIVESFAGADPDDFELGVSVAASLASHIIQTRNQAGLFVNARLPIWDEHITLAPAGSVNQLVHILEALARVTPQPSSPFEAFFSDIYRSLPWGTTCVFIMNEPPEHIRPLLSQLKERGFKSVVMQIGKERGRAPDLASAWHFIKRPEHFAHYAGGSAAP